MKAKRTIACALALSMLAATATSLGASAAGSSVTLAGSKATAESGGEFSVDVSLSGVPSTGINVLDFAVTFDQTILSVDQVTVGAAADTGADAADSTSKDAPVFATNIKDARSQSAGQQLLRLQLDQVRRCHFDHYRYGKGRRG